MIQREVQYKFGIKERTRWRSLKAVLAWAKANRMLIRAIEKDYVVIETDLAYYRFRRVKRGQKTPAMFIEISPLDRQLQP